MFRDYNIADLSVFVLLYLVQHIEFVAILSLQFEDETVLEFERDLFRIWHIELKLGKGLLHSLADNLERLGGNHKGLLHLELVFRFDIDGVGVVDFVLLLLEVFLKVGIVVRSKRDHYSSLAGQMFLVGDHVIVFLFDSQYLER